MDRELIARDPVLRELSGATFSAEHDFSRLAAIAARHPGSAMLLGQIFGEPDLPAETLQSVLASAGGQASAPRAAEFPRTLDQKHDKAE